MAKRFSWRINGKRRLPSSCLLMQPVLRATVLSLVSIGFAARGLLRGPPLNVSDSPFVAHLGAAYGQQMRGLLHG